MSSIPAEPPAGPRHPLSLPDCGHLSFLLGSAPSRCLINVNQRMLRRRPWPLEAPSPWVPLGVVPRQWRAGLDRAHVCPAAQGRLLGFPGGGGGCGRSCPAGPPAGGLSARLGSALPPAVPPLRPQLAPPRLAVGRQGPPAPPSRCAQSPWRGDSRKEARPGWAFISGPHKEGRGDPLAERPLLCPVVPCGAGEKCSRADGRY